MTPAARIAAVIEILDEIIHQPKPADTIMSAYFRARKFIGSKDRTAIASQSYRSLRRYLRLEFHIKNSQAKLTARNLVLVELFLAEQQSIDDIARIFSGQQYAPARLTSGEIAWLEKLGTAFEPPAMPISVRLECPDAYAEKFVEVFGDRLATEMQAMMTEASLDLRVNPRVIARDAAIRELQQHDIQCTATPISPFGIRVTGRPALPTLDLFKRGGVEIQDEGSQLIAFLLGAKPGEAVVDFCAGAGGKTLAIAAMMENKGRVVACDVLEKRLARSRVRFTRAGLDNIITRPLSSENDKWVKRSKGTFDRVLVDAPCSGTGVWRRNPDARWKHLGPGLDELLPLQESILNSASRLVKPGGTLVYATCSLLPDENQNQVQKFLTTHPDFQLLPVRDAWKNALATEAPTALQGEMMALTPAQHQTDGFFAAVMTRK